MNEQQLLKYNAYLKDLNFEQNHINELHLFGERAGKQYRALKWCLYFLFYCVSLYLLFKLDKSIINAFSGRGFAGLVILVSFFPAWHFFFLFFIYDTPLVKSTAFDFHNKAKDHALGTVKIFYNKPHGYHCINDTFKALPFMEGYRYITNHNNNKEVWNADGYFAVIAGLILFIIMVFLLLSGITHLFS